MDEDNPEKKENKIEEIKIIIKKLITLILILFFVQWLVAKTRTRTL